MIVDLMNLEWWQGVTAIVGVLGLSPAPWLLGLATNRIQFTKTAREDYATRVADLTSAHAAAVAELVKHHADIEDGWQRQYDELKESRNYYREARLEDSDRANRVTAQLAEVATEAGKIANAAFDIIGNAGPA